MRSNEEVAIGLLRKIANHPAVDWTKDVLVLDYDAGHHIPIDRDEEYLLSNLVTPRPT